MRRASFDFCKVFQQYKEEMLCNCLRAGELDNAQKILCQLIDSFESKSHLNPNNIMMFNINLYTDLMRFAHEQHLPASFIVRYSDIAPSVNGIKSLEKSSSFFGEMVYSIGDAMEQSRRNRINRYYDTIVEYIEANYSRNEMSLELASAEMNISVSYINQILKSQEDKTFNQRLTEARMAKACELLKETNMKIQDVAMAVGYSGSNYFVRSFKALTGVTPGKYREGSWQ